MRDYPQIDWEPGGTFAAALRAVRDAKLRRQVREEYTKLIKRAGRLARKDKLRPKCRSPFV